MSKIELPTITSGYNLSTINNNFQKIEDALNKEVLYRKNYTGEPNEMQTNLDMNGKEILNVNVGSSPNSLATKGYVDQGLSMKFDKSGGPLSGPVDMQNNQINNLPNATQSSQPATYAQLLQVEAHEDSLLRSELSAPGGARLIGFQQSDTGAVERTAESKLREVVSVKDFGAAGDGVTDDTGSIISACTALQSMFETDGISRTLVFPDGQYRTSDTIVVHPNMAVDCRGRVVFQNKGTSKTFPAVELQGGNKRAVLGVIDGYGAGIRIRGNTHNVDFQLISNCIDGVVLRADANWPTTKNNLDNVIRGVQIGLCTNGIVFEQNGDSRVQQGNEFRINFISETTNAVLFRTYDGFVHTKQSSWDSNTVELQAFDPLSLAGASMVRNSTGFAVPDLKMTVKAWLGGWVTNAETICLIRGPFSETTYEVSLAGGIGLNELVDTAGRSSFGSCVFKNTRQTNLGSATAFYLGVPAGDVFNGGVSLNARKFRIRVAVPDLAANAVYASSFNHVLVQVSDTGRARLVQTPGAARGRYRIEITDAGTENKGMVRIWVSNYTSTLQTGRDVDMIFEME